MGVRLYDTVAETHGWPMEDIRDEALAAHWLRPSRSGRASGSLLRSLFSRKMYKDGHWRGVGPGDLVWLPGGEPAGQIRACVTGKSGCVLLCRRMRRLAWEPYGSRWLLLADEFLLQPGKGGALELPSWWRFDEANAVTCLH